jgi:NTE family protein
MGVGIRVVELDRDQSQTEVAMTSPFTLAQDSDYEGNDYWRWSVWLDAAHADLDAVDHVVYTLDPSYRNPVRTVSDRSTRFRLEAGGWDAFKVFATVVFAAVPGELPRKNENLDLELALEYPEEQERLARDAAAGAGLRLEQGSEYEGSDRWRWWIWLDGPTAEFEKVDHVIYTLHPSFPAPVRTVSDRKTRFRLETAGWGTFTIQATLVGKEGYPDEYLEHELVFEYPEEAEKRAHDTEATRPPIRPPELGLALSGGGFRASFFHVGVLARLAETGVLRKVEVISTVSGGSILGALYYLALKDLLENVPDEEITDQHYVDVVRRVETTLFEGVARHVRARTYSDLGKNLRMRKPDYSRSDRLGELYDEIFYSPTWAKSQFGAGPARREFNGPIQLRELLIVPPGETQDFSPRRQNHTRNAPVPILLLNATSLNTGHNWRFQAVEMGEDPRSRESWVQIDKNMRLLSARYWEMTPRQSDFPLGHAVAASACVPALFHPLAVSNLFDGVRVELVDGGVHDNQGVCGLFDADVRRMIVSDASGQMVDLAEPSTRIPAAAGRSSSIYGDRVREEQLLESLGRPDTVLLHLRKGLPATAVSPFGVNGGPLAAVSQLGMIDYQVASNVQERLARVRTDLDSFTEIEAYSLALYGYLMTCGELPEQPDKVAYEWNLSSGDLEALRMELRAPSAAYLNQLTVAARRFRKGAALNPMLRALELGGAVVVLAVLGVAAYFVHDATPAQVATWWLLVAVLGPALLVGLYFKGRFRSAILRRLADGLYTWLLPVLAAPLLWLSCRITLWASRRFLARGRIADVAAADGIAKSSRR